MACLKKLHMSNWKSLTAVLCLFGFLINCRPLEPFLTAYLVGPYKNATQQQVINVLFPIWTYSYLALLFPVFMVTDLLRYKPVMVLQAVFAIITFVLLCFAQGMASLKAVQFCFAMVTATEVAYFSYIYSMVPSKHYQQVTSFLRSANLLGFMSAAILGQLLVSFAELPYFYLGTITIGAESAALLLSTVLPMPSRSMFYRSEDGAQCNQMDLSKKDMNSDAKEAPVCENVSAIMEVKSIPHLRSTRENVSKTLSQLWYSFKVCYSSRKVIYSSLWWAFATCGHNQVYNYTQSLFQHIAPSGNFSVYNGAVEAAASVVGSMASFSVTFMTLDWDTWGELILGIFSSVSTSAIFMMAFTNSIWLCYAGYIILRASYMLLITITMFLIADNLSDECYALMFGINTFVALLLQTLLTAIVVDESSLGLGIVNQFIIYGSYYTVISVIFLLRGIYVLCYKWKRRQPQGHEDVLSEAPFVIFSQKL
ncbi:solute carrier family 19 member 3b [Erpetoichthys calabaricus]|uniref:solute carrier family 19 member 3b n=1 Tax=Erpetoichthys calabaricus TaxID=27687 RepID=UPI00109EE368|nr:solute carrier family 19 member 3b [Erpetoichthys calabaricus]